MLNFPYFVYKLQMDSRGDVGYYLLFTVYILDYTVQAVAASSVERQYGTRWYNLRQ